MCDFFLLSFSRGYWTLCPGEVTVRFHTCIVNGLAGASLPGCADPSDIPASLPSPRLTLLSAAAILRAVRPASLATCAVAGTQLRRVRGSPAIFGVLGFSVALLGASYVLDRFVLSVRRLREHVHFARHANGKQEVMVKTTRNGKQRFLPGRSLVPGDVVHLNEGDYVAADCRVIESRGLRIDDSFFPHRGIVASAEDSADELPRINRMKATNPVLGLDCHRQVQSIRGQAVTATAEDEESSVLNARCVAFATSTVTAGTAIAVVTRTGEDTAVCLLLSRLCSFSLLEVLFSTWV